MLGSALELRRAFERLADFDHSYSDLPTSEEWDVGSRVHGCLKVFYEASTSLSGSKYVTANLYFHDVCDVHIHLLEWLNDGEHLYIQRMATTMMLKFQKYWEDCSLILTVALVLDPRFKMEYVDYTYRQLYGDGAAFIHTERVRSYLYELYSEYAANELNLYLEETIFPDESGFNLLFWWRSYGTKFPILSKMARDILAVPVSSVASESAFFFLSFG
ncbi:hypothetical protein QJS04_geneDACA016203 [Acorus gramineus]|uniref:Uncharacterized protein n=1 Tax=Acorus gramineus TaxID=55184 RepID=A0AAV9B753_ACOGR|nr:hypothetical protein QJS04_geneDACA016203 [Acorus gramineus]